MEFGRVRDQTGPAADKVVVLTLTEVLWRRVEARLHQHAKEVGGAQAAFVVAVDMVVLETQLHTGNREVQKTGYGRPKGHSARERTE